MQRLVPGRSITQVRTHAQKYVAKSCRGLTLEQLGVLREAGADGPMSEASLLARLRLQRLGQQAVAAASAQAAAQAQAQLVAQAAGITALT